MKYLMLLISIIALAGCNLDDSSDSSTCIDCIWDESSQTLVRGVRGGFAGISDPVSVYFPESGEYVSPPEASSHTTDTGYTKSGMSVEALEYLRTVKITQETFMSDECSFDSMYPVIKITNKIDSETAYYSNELDCTGNIYVEGRNYIPHHDMEALLELFPSATSMPIDPDDIVLITPNDNIWPDSSQRVEVAIWDNTTSVFDTVIDLTRDTMTEEFSNSLKQVEYFTGTLNCTDGNQLPEQTSHYQITITDETGLTRVYNDTVLSCESGTEEISYIRTEDINGLIESSGVEF